jgi:hypothetical protein
MLHREVPIGDDLDVPLILSQKNLDEDLLVEQLISKYADSSTLTEDVDQIHTILYIKTFKRNYFMTIIWYLLCVVSLGAVFVLGRWMPWIRLSMTHSNCSKQTATKVLLKVLRIYQI